MICLHCDEREASELSGLCPVCSRSPKTRALFSTSKEDIVVDTTSGKLPCLGCSKPVLVGFNQMEVCKTLKCLWSLCETCKSRIGEIECRNVDTSALAGMTNLKKHDGTYKQKRKKRTAA